MDHRWDAATRADRAARDERERYGARPIARDPDVERRDRLRDDEHRRAVNQTPWSIGAAHYDQRDLYTRNASIAEDGYGLGPAIHPEEGSYAYRRDGARAPDAPRDVVEEADATRYEREAWPWLNYKRIHDAPYFQHLHPRGPTMWERFLRRLTGQSAHHPTPAERIDARIKDDVEGALAYEGELDASDIVVTVNQAEVTLTGTVPDCPSKRLAEEKAQAVRGVRDVHNELTIRRDDGDGAAFSWIRPLSLLWG